MTTNPLRVSRGNTASITARVLLTGELAYNTQTDQLHVGDGVTLGGVIIVPGSDDISIDSRLDALEAADVTFDGRVDALEALTTNLGSTAISSAWATVVQASTGAAGLAAAGGTIVAASNSALAALASAARASGAMYCTLGYASAGDGGGGFWRWNSSDLQTKVSADAAGGLYVAPSGGNGSTGAFERQFTNDLDAKWFGAKGDGTTDDTTAIQRSLTLAATLGVSGKTGGDVCLSPGRYLISSAIDVPARVTIYSQNSGSTIIKFDSGATAANMIRLADESEIRGIQLDGANTGLTGVLFNGCERATATDVYVYDTSSQGFAFVAGAHHNKMDSCTAESCGDRGVNIGTGLTDQDPAHHNLITNFTAIDNDDAGVLFGHSVHDNIVDGFIITGTNNASLWLVANCYRNVCKNGTISAPNTDAGDDVQGIWVTQKCYENIFEGITVQGHKYGIICNSNTIDNAVTADGSDGNSYGNIFSNFTFIGPGSGTSGSFGIGLINNHASYKGATNKFANCHMRGYATGLKGEANTGDGNTFSNITMEDVTTKVDIPATQWLKQRFSQVAGISDASFKARLASDQTIQGDTWVTLVGATEVFDVGSYYDASSTYRWTPPAGRVQLQASALLTTNTLDGVINTVAIFKNGQLFANGSPRISGAAGATQALISVLDQANGTDYYEAKAYADTTGIGVTDATLQANSGDGHPVTWFSGFMLP